MLLVVVMMAAGVLVGVDVQTAEAASIDTTGPHSKNKIERKDRKERRVRNNTRVRVNNVTDQIAETGDAKVKKNTMAGDAETGDAHNDNATDVSGSVDNSGASGSYGSDCGCDSDDSIDTTGPHSTNKIVRKNKNVHKVRNNTRIGVNNDTYQEAVSGDAKVKYNTDAGDAATGDAENNNDTNVDVEVDNSGAAAHHGGSDCGCAGDAEISKTGPGSKNVIKSANKNTSSVNNTTNLNVSNSTGQFAGSGNAYVSGNTMGGDASTGNAANSNSTSMSFAVTN
jgi:hypothetical protein